MDGLITLNIVATANLFFAFLVLFFKRNNAHPNKILALIIINPAINFIANVLILSGAAAQFSYFIYCSILTAFFFGPLVYYYVIIMMGMKFNWKNPVLYLTGTALLYCLYMIANLEIGGVNAVNAFFKGLELGPYPEQMEIMDTVFIVLQQTYFTMALVQYVRYKGKIKKVFSNIASTRERYVFFFILFIWLLNLATIALYAIFPFSEVQYLYLPLVLMAIFLFIFIAAFNFNSVFAHEEFERFISQNEVIEENLNAKDKEETESNKERLAAIAQKLVLSMEEGHYKTTDLNVKLLAELVDEPVYLVSKCLNQYLNQSFHEFVNEYRIEAFIEKSKNASHLTIEGIALEVGFSNRASFYRIYKKKTGMTPSQNEEYPKNEVLLN